MPTINYSKVDLSQKFYGNVVVIYTWTPLVNGDSGLPVMGPGWADRSFQIEGTFGVGGTVVIEGSNELTPTNYRTLNDPFGNALSITQAGVYELTQIALWMRVRVSAGDGTTSVSVNACLGRHGYP